MRLKRKINNSPQEAATRRALIEAAAEAFAARGFRPATVREICQQAGANVAAINYHFGDKEALYAEVLRHCYRLALATYPTDLGLPANTPPEEQLAAFIRAFLLRIFSQGPVALHGRLMAREMVEPTRALDGMIEEFVRPAAERLSGIVRRLLGARADHETVRLACMSVVGQCLFYHHGRPAITRLFPEQHYDAPNIERLATHITDFSLAALRHLPARTTTARAVKPRRPARKNS